MQLAKIQGYWPQFRIMDNHIHYKERGILRSHDKSLFYIHFYIFYVAS